jgi:hypothetical protein
MIVYYGSVDTCGRRLPAGCLPTTTDKQLDNEEQFLRAHVHHNPCT